MAGIFDVSAFLTPLVSKLADFIPDPVEKAKAQAEATTEMLQFISSQNTAQIAVDAAEANNKNLFVAGWRPFIGWVCGAAFAYEYVVQPLATWTAALTGHPVNLPALDDSGMMPVLLSMLGMGAMRSYEKVAGVAPPGAK